MSMNLLHAQMKINRAVWALNDKSTGKQHDPAAHDGLSREQHIALLITGAVGDLQQAVREYPHQPSLFSVG